MARKLKKLLIDRVDLVPDGANPDAHIVLFKSAAVTKEEMGEDEMPLTTNQRLQQRQLWDEWHPLWNAFCQSVWEIMECGEDAGKHAPILMQSIDEFSTKAKEILAGLGLVEKAAPLLAICAEVRKAGAVMAASRRKRLQDAIEALQAILNEAAPKEDGSMEKGSSMAEKTASEQTELAKAQERIAALETELATAKSALAQAQQTPEEQEAAYLKSLPESVRKQREVEKAENAALREELRVEKEARLQQTYIEKTAAFRALGITPDHWNILKSIDALPEQERTELHRILACATELVKQGGSKVFKTAGRDGGGNAGGSAQEQVDRYAKALMADDPKLTYQVALGKVFREHPDLYEQQRREARSHAD